MIFPTRFVTIFRVSKQALERSVYANLVVFCANKEVCTSKMLYRYYSNMNVSLCMSVC